MLGLLPLYSSYDETLTIKVEIVGFDCQVS